VLDGNGVAYSSDGGQTWTRTKLNTGADHRRVGRVEVAFSKSNPNIAYAVVDVSQGQLYKSTTAASRGRPMRRFHPAHLGVKAGTTTRSGSRPTTRTASSSAA
jgi:hypothetical protein